MKTTWKIPEFVKEDIQRFRDEIERFERGEISLGDFRAFRVTRGVYEQRGEGEYMMRNRIPAGILLPDQMRTLARVAKKYGNGVLHFTTRQDVQIHRVALQDIPAVLSDLLESGLSTYGGCGDTPRNVTTCSHAGVGSEEHFDVSPYAIAVTEFLLDKEESLHLPRKYKISFSGCPEDCAGAMISDLGFLARIREGHRGFSVYVGGGLGRQSRIADLLESFIPAERVGSVALAVMRVFSKHGNRENRGQARLRFLVRDLGIERFAELYREELTGVNAPLFVPDVRDGILPLPSPSDNSSVKVERSVDRNFRRWVRNCTVPQKQPGLHMIHIRLLLGDIPSDRLEKLADVVERHGEKVLRSTQEQNLVLRGLRKAEMEFLYAELEEIQLAEPAPALFRNLTPCIGAGTCRLGVCDSRRLARKIEESLAASGLNLTDLGNLRIRISGCPNGCSRHAVADIGLNGVLRKVDGKSVPHYVVHLGGGLGEGGVTLAEPGPTVPEERIPQFITALLHAYALAEVAPDFRRFLEQGGRKEAERLATEVPSLAELSYHI